MESIIVTGASTGIGHATARRLAESGALVFAGVRNETDRQRMSEAHPNIRPVILDVTVPSDIIRTVESVQASEAPLSAIVNNAGIAVAGPLEFLPLQSLRQQFEVNVMGPMALTQAALPLLRKSTGRIVFIGSIAGRLSAPFVGAYSASKSALASLADALRQELASFGISVSLLEFASVKTPIWQKGREEKDRLIASMPPEAFDYYGKMVDAVVKQTQREEHEGMDPMVIANTVLDAIKSARPRERYVIGRKAQIQSIAAILPPRTRDALVKRAMQLP